MNDFVNLIFSTVMCTVGFIVVGLFLFMPQYPMLPAFMGVIGAMLGVTIWVWSE